MKRKPQYPIDEMFINRWSPRAMSGEVVTDLEINSLLEAARWAPSSYNNQPWRFLYAQKNSPYWETYLNLLVPFNQSWAKNAWVLMVIISRDTFSYNNKPSVTHSFDTGSAWQNLALQGSIMNLAIRGMEGFDYVQAKKVLQIPDGYTVEAMFAVGKPADKSVLPKELQEREEPSDRKPIDQWSVQGLFTKAIE